MTLARIESRDNHRLVTLRKVRDGKIRDSIFIEGRRLGEEALRSGMQISDCFVVEDFRERDLISRLEQKGARIFELPTRVFKTVSSTDHSQGIIALAERPLDTLDLGQYKSARIPVFLFLNEINNPSNLGAVLRSAEAAGAAGVIVSRNSADIFSAKSLRASMGAGFRIPLKTGADFDEVVRKAASVGVSCVAMVPDAKQSYVTLNWKNPHLVILGSEAHGLSDAEMKLVGLGISIPMEEHVESLNIAAAAAVVMFEARRQTSDPY